MKKKPLTPIRPRHDQYNKYKIWIILTFLVGIGSIYPQNNGEGELGHWYLYFGTYKVAEHWSIYSEAQLRYFESAENFNQLFLFAGGNYHINKNLIANVTYGFIDSDPTFTEEPLGDTPFHGNRFIEHRLHEQIVLKDKLWEFLLEHRYRFEQRFFENKDLARTSGDMREMQNRFRYRLQMTLPITDTFFLNFFDEIFLNFQDSVFNQNLLYTAVGIRMTENSNIQLGYLKNHFPTAHYDRLHVTLVYNPDLRKKSE